MTSVNVTTQSNTVTVQQGDATTVTIATQGPQGPAGAGSSNVVDDTSPQLGGDLQSNGNDIDFADNDKAIFGTGSDLHIFHNANGSFISHELTSSKLFIQTNSSDGIEINKGQSENIAKFIPDGAVELYHNNVKKVETSATGIDVTGNINLPDSTSNTVGRIMLGDGTEMQIQYDGGGGFIGNFSGNLTFHCNALRFMNGAKTENFIVANENSSVELYHDNVKKIETSANGVDVTGTVDLSSAESNSSNTAQFKLSNLTIGQHNNTGSYRFANAGTGSFLFTADNINFFNKDVNKNFLRLSASGVELYHDNVKKAETSADGLDLPDMSKLQLGDSQDLQIFHSGNHSFIKDTGNGSLFICTNSFQVNNAAANESIIVGNQNGAVELYHDNVKKIETSADGVNLPDNSKLQLGDSQDLKIYHNTNSYIDNSTGITFIRNTGSNGSQIQLLNNNSGIKIQGTTGEQSIICQSNGSVELYHDNVKKVETTSSGITVTGSVTTQDMNMSNLNGTANEVDNTKGSWSIQEGADNLFLINRVSGKKYKFNLTEVS